MTDRLRGLMTGLGLLTLAGGAAAAEPPTTPPSMPRLACPAENVPAAAALPVNVAWLIATPGPASIAAKSAGLPPGKLDLLQVRRG